MNELEGLGLIEQPDKKYSIWKRLGRFVNKLFILFTYIKILKLYREDLDKYFKIRIDYVYRMYTILVIPEETMSLLSVRDNKFEYVFTQEVMAQITSYIQGLEKYFQTIGLSKEWYGISEMESIDQQNYKLVISFALFDTVKIANTIITIAIILAVLAFIFLVAGAYLIIKYFIG